MTLPNFLIIGAPKSGTTSLYKYLQQHPQIFMPEIKEPHFFSFEGRTEGYSSPGQKDFLKKRITRFEDYVNLFDSVQEETAIGEASTSYIHVPGVVERIQKYIPHTKIIAILRQPADRAFSHYLHHYRDGGEVLDFSEAIAAEQSRQAKNWSPMWLYKDIGFYAKHLASYYQTFPKEQIKVYLYEDLSKDPLSVVHDLYEFLEVSSLEDSEIDISKHNVSLIKTQPRSKFIHSLVNKENPFRTVAKNIFPANTRKRIRDLITRKNQFELSQPYKPVIDPHYRVVLTKEYQEDIQKLQNLIDRDLSAWLSTS